MAFFIWIKLIIDYIDKWVIWLNLYIFDNF